MSLTFKSDPIRWPLPISTYSLGVARYILQKLVMTFIIPGLSPSDITKIIPKERSKFGTCISLSIYESLKENECYRKCCRLKLLSMARKWLARLRSRAASSKRRPHIQKFVISKLVLTANFSLPSPHHFDSTKGPK